MDIKLESHRCPKAPSLWPHRTEICLIDPYILSFSKTKQAMPKRQKVTLCAPTGTHTHTSHFFYKNGFSNNKRVHLVVYSTSPQCENCRTQQAHFPHQAPSNHIMSWRQMREIFHQRTTNACAQRPSQRNPPICSATDIPTWERSGGS